MGRIATGITMSAKSAGKSAKEAAKGATKAAEAAKEVPKFKKQPGQTVSDPQRMAFPGIYKRPDIIAQEAASMVAPESPSMKELFGVTRDELYDISKGLRGNLPGELPGAAAKPRGSEAAEKVMGKENTQRLLDVLSEVERFPELMKGMDSWYTMVPLYQKAVEVLGADRAKAEYPIMNALMGMASPGSAVTTEIPRGTAAYYLQKQGRFPEFMTELGKPVGLRDPGLDPEILGVPGHPYHKTAQGLPMQRFLETGEMQMESPKVPMYIEASGVPETGFQTRTPVGDAHFVRGVGLADVRTNKGFAGSITTPEMTSIAPWWREKVAGELGIESVPAQARTWGAFAPQTGVDTPIGAPKLELIADDIMRAARRLNISPIEARDRWLRGEIRLGGDVGKAEGGSVSEPGSADYGAPADPLQYEDPQEIERYMRESAADVRLNALNDELQSKIEMYRRGLLTAKDMQEFFPGYSDFDLAGMFGMTDEDLPRDPEISRRRLTPEFLANALSFEEQLKKELEEDVRKGGKKLLPPKYERKIAEGGQVGLPAELKAKLAEKMRSMGYAEGGSVGNWRERLAEKMQEMGYVQGFSDGGLSEGWKTKHHDYQTVMGEIKNDIPSGNVARMADGGEVDEESRPKLEDEERNWELQDFRYEKHYEGERPQTDMLFRGKRIEAPKRKDEYMRKAAKGGPIYMRDGGDMPEEEPIMDEIAYMSQALSPEGEAENPERASKLRSALRAGKIIAAGVPKSFVSPVVGMYGSLKSGKFGSQEGIRAGEAAMEEFMTPSEETIAELQSDPLAMEYLENVSKFAEELGTKYKLAAQPDILGNLGAARGVGTQVRGLAREAAGKARDMAKEVPPLPVGLSIQPVGKPVAEVIKPGKIKVPASELGFYSALDKAAANLQRKQGTGEAFLSDIKKFNPSADELQDTGLADWLKSQKTVTKQDVIDYINGNKLEVTEKVRGEPIGEADFIKVGKLEQRISRGDPTLTDEELNWFEINKKKVMNSMFEDLNPEYNEFDLMIPGGKNYREIQLRVPGVKHTSAHYPQDKDMIAWLRVQDKTIDGKKTLVIEEVQSDLHQKGRDLGYRSKDVDESVVKKELANATEAANNLESRYNNAVSDFILKSGAGELRGEANAEAVRNIEALKIQLDAARSVQKEKEKLAKQPSDAPFKESWYQLALKRAMKYAADNDFDQVALVGAEEQIKRYQLSRKVNSIQVQPEGTGKRITVQIKTKGDVDFVIDENGIVVDVSRTDFEKAVGKDLSDVVGKPMAKKLMETERGVIAGGDLDIGGKGMLKYYNEVYPKYLEKQYSKKYGVKPQRKDHIIGEYGPDDVEERETGEVDRFNRPTFGYLVRDRDTGEDVAYESTFEKALSEANKKAPSVPMWLMDVPQNLKSDVKIGQSYKKGGAVKMRNGGPIVSAYNTIPDVTDAGALKLAAYEQELKRYA